MLALASPATAAADPEQLLLEALRGQAPVRRALARLAGRLVETSGWERIGFARLGDYARERLGLSARQVRDLAHVDGALARLPGVERALLAQEISWSKARLVCRVATASDESDWVAFARTATVRELERSVRAVDVGSLEGGALTALDESDPERRESIEIRCTPIVRAKWWRVKWLAQRVAGERLPQWACMEAVVAEALSTMPTESVPEPAPHEAMFDEAEPCVTAPAVCDAARDPIPYEPRTCDAFELDRRLRSAVRHEQLLWAEVGRHLAAAVAARTPARRGFRSVDAYARECLGVSPRKARALLRLERAGEFCPALRAAYREGRLSWVQAHVLLPLLWLEACSAHRERWLDHAQRVSVRRLEDDVDRALAMEEFEPPPAVPERQTCAQPTFPEQHTGLDESARFFFLAPSDAARLIRATICSVRRGLDLTEGGAVEAMFDHVLATWDPGRTERAHRVFERDGWRCTAPGCSSFRNLHDHHIVFRSHCGGDEVSNRTTLCAWHHQRGVHAGRIRCLGGAPHALIFELGVRPGHPPTLRFRSGDVHDVSAGGIS